jgi:hypothetical protein
MARRRALSSRHPDRLVPPGRLHPLCRALAALDAILWPDEDDRAFLYTARWERGASVLEWRDGSGDFLFVWFPSKTGGAVIRGFAHESVASPWARGGSGKADPRLWEGLPRAFRAAAREPGFGGDELTFTLWWDPDEEQRWIAGGGGRDDDGSAELLARLDGDPKSYARDASERLERRVSTAAVKAIFDGAQVDDALLRALAPDGDREAIRAALVELGWPIAVSRQATAKARRAPALLESAFTIAVDDDRTLLIIGDRVQADGPPSVFG